jgi:hypothetical protein
MQEVWKSPCIVILDLEIKAAMKRKLVLIYRQCNTSRKETMVSISVGKD